jgi:hypothetical protein
MQSEITNRLLLGCSSFIFIHFQFSPLLNPFIKDKSLSTSEGSHSMGLSEKELTELKEFAQWKYQKNAIIKDTNLTKKEKKLTIKAIDKIANILGEHFLEEVLKDGHPIFQYLANTAPWTRLWLIRFANILTSFEDSSNFDQLIKKLRYAEGYLAVMSELEVANRFRRLDYQIDFYPKTSSRYISDFLAKKDNACVYFEVSNINWSEEKRKSVRTFDEIALVPYTVFEVETAGKIYKSLSRPRIQGLKREINHCIEKAKMEKRLLTLSIPGIIDFAVAPRTLSQEVTKWRTEIGMGDHNWEGPLYDSNELSRIRKTFRDENRQLPKESPGVIVLYDHDIHAQNHQDFYKALTYALEEEIYEHSNLIAGALIFPDFTGASESGCYNREITWSCKEKLDYTGENTLVIRNKYSKFEVDEQIIRALIV